MQKKFFQILLSGIIPVISLNMHHIIFYKNIFPLFLYSFNDCIKILYIFEYIRMPVGHRILSRDYRSLNHSYLFDQNCPLKINFLQIIL